MMYPKIDYTGFDEGPSLFDYPAYRMAPEGRQEIDKRQKLTRHEIPYVRSFRYEICGWYIHGVNLPGFTIMYTWHRMTNASLDIISSEKVLSHFRENDHLYFECMKFMVRTFNEGSSVFRTEKERQRFEEEVKSWYYSANYRDPEEKIEWVEGYDDFHSVGR